MADSPALTVRVSANLDQLRQALRDGTDSISTTAAAMSKLAQSFSGDTIIRQANAAVAAIGGIEGVSKLTEAQQAKVNTLLTEAVAKYQALGQHAPSAMVALRDATEQTEGPMSKLKDLAGELGINLGVLTAVGAAGAFFELGKGAVESASQLEHLSLRTGISTDDLQKLKYAGEAAGIGIDQIATGINRLQKNLIEDGPKAQVALSKLGLSAETLVQMAPAQMFEEISAKLALIPNPAERSAIAMELLGRSGTELLPLLLQDVNKLGEGAVIMSETTIQNLHMLEVAWEHLKTNVGSTVGGMISDFSTWRDTGVSVLAGLAGAISPFAQTWVEDQLRIKKATEDASASLTAATGYNKQALEDLAAVKKLDEEASKKAAEEQGKYNESLKAWADIFTGKDLIAKAHKLNDEVDAAGGFAKGTWAEQVKLVGTLVQLHDEGVKLEPRLKAIVDQYRFMYDTGLLVNRNGLDLVSTFQQIDLSTWRAQTSMDLWGQTVKISSTGLDKFIKQFPSLQGAFKDTEIAIDDAAKAHQRFVDNVSHASDQLVGAIGKGWKGLEGALEGIFGDILHSFEHDLIEKMLLSLLTGTNQMSGMFSGLSGAFGGGAAKSAGAGAGAAGTAGAGLSIGAGIATAGIGLVVGGIPAILATNKMYRELEAQITALGGKPDEHYKLPKGVEDMHGPLDNYRQQLADLQKKASASAAAGAFIGPTSGGDVAAGWGSGGSGGGPVIQNVTINIDASGAVITDDASLRRLTDKIALDLPRALGDLGYV